MNCADHILFHLHHLWQQSPEWLVYSAQSPDQYQRRRVAEYEEIVASAVLAAAAILLGCVAIALWPQDSTH